MGGGQRTIGGRGMEQNIMVIEVIEGQCGWSGQSGWCSTSLFVCNGVQSRQVDEWRQSEIECA